MTDTHLYNTQGVGSPWTLTKVGELQAAIGKFTDVGLFPLSGVNYIVSYDSTSAMYFARNGKTGAIDSSSATYHTVMAYAYTHILYDGYIYDQVSNRTIPVKRLLSTKLEAQAITVDVPFTVFEVATPSTGVIEQIPTIGGNYSVDLANNNSIVKFTIDGTVSYVDLQTLFCYGGVTQAAEKTTFKTERLIGYCDKDTKKGLGALRYPIYWADSIKIEFIPITGNASAFFYNIFYRLLDSKSKASTKIYSVPWNAYSGYGKATVATGAWKTLATSTGSGGRVLCLMVTMDTPAAIEEGDFVFTLDGRAVDIIATEDAFLDYYRFSTGVYAFDSAVHQDQGNSIWGNFLNVGDYYNMTFSDTMEIKWQNLSAGNCDISWFIMVETF